MKSWTENPSSFGFIVCSSWTETHLENTTTLVSISIPASSSLVEISGSVATHSRSAGTLNVRSLVFDITQTLSISGQKYRSVRGAPASVVAGARLTLFSFVRSEE
ncbi:ORF920 [White spot syndrome virus]|uniref:ORF920 n=1 Tax=White spot syndrome virus TaxID=342409 RepID=A0A2D3I5G1_9VIRU|nr:ORF920 [White spot syndrome virus]